jgi:hypothetical protein
LAVNGSTIVTRSSADSVIGLQTWMRSPYAPSSSYSTFTAWIPPWLWPTIIGIAASCS